jgi:arginase family enzyme
MEDAMPSQTVRPFSQAQHTFFNAPLTTIEDLRPGQVAIAGAPHDSTHSTRFGTRYGPRGIREGSLAVVERLNSPDGVLDLATGQRRRYVGNNVLADVGDLNVYPTDLMGTTEGIRQGVAAICRQGAFPVTLGGDHYISYPSFMGYADAIQETTRSVRVGYIHIDGHLDFNDQNPIWGRYNHGTNARRISEHEIVPLENMVWVGIQGWVTYAEWHRIKRMGGTVFTHEDVRSQGIVEVARRAGEIASRGCDWVYLSLDIDVLDAGFSPGTGGVVIGGMRPIDVVKAMHELSAFPIGAMDLTEVSPNLDASGRTVRLAAEAVAHLVGPRLFDQA